jgi:multidrug efflux pump subunit AcrA (membrane-fusion protein)
MTPLFKIASLSPLWLEIQVPVAKVGRLQPQDEVAVAPDLASGKILAIGNSVDAVNQSVTVRAEITVTDRKLRPQQVVEAEITPAASGEKLWGAHPASVIRHQGKAYVFVQTDGGFRPQEVELQDETAEIAILSGPFDGTERIATKGLVPLKGAWQGLGGSEE